jgi:chemotaxis protein MotB
MNDSDNPFAGPAKPTPPHGRQVYVAWTVAVVMAMTALMFLMIWTRAKSSHQREMAGLRAGLDGASGDLARALADSQTNRDLVAKLRLQVADLEKERDLAGQMARNLETEMRADLESKDVAISKLQGRLTMTILDRVLFDSGEAVLKPDGAAVMNKIATFLAAHPELKIHVVGHTDNVPIRPAAQGRFASNWELSTARALAAVHFLTEKAGVDSSRVGAVGYGEFRPVADNSTSEGRARNRRIAITILPEDAPAESIKTSPPAMPASDGQ